MIMWHFSDITNSFSRILHSWKFLFFKVFFSFSFWQSRCFIGTLNSKGDLTRKHLNLELVPEGGFPAFVLQIYRNSNCYTLYLSSYMRYCKIFFSFQLPFIRSFRKNQKHWEIKKFKIDIIMTSANMKS